LNFFLDLSALAKRYVEEAGSDRVEQALFSASFLGLSLICASDVVSALCRRRREKTLSPEQYRKAKQLLLEDIGDASLVNVTGPVVARAVELLERGPCGCRMPSMLPRRRSGPPNCLFPQMKGSARRIEPMDFEWSRCRQAELSAGVQPSLKCRR
jgi:uncharacterized protein